MCEDVRILLSLCQNKGGSRGTTESRGGKTALLNQFLAPLSSRIGSFSFPAFVPQMKCEYRPGKKNSDELMISQSHLPLCKSSYPDITSLSHGPPHLSNNATPPSHYITAILYGYNGGSSRISARLPVTSHSVQFQPITPPINPPSLSRERAMQIARIRRKTGSHIGSLMKRMRLLVNIQRLYDVLCSRHRHVPPGRQDGFGEVRTQHARCFWTGREKVEVGFVGWP